ncbi:paraquat-inducible protein A [Sphingomonas nostoxanthinifaciens]|uniref:paraquat-inducible protein A n=1 Tax=Sphingomonas nostoxanthinifaciens TaxID=2872652 RepID=UPI001CC1CA1A|nr:paraquat-inducible protein A [Sphingomonas nostoxanthinifaciens]UAK24287.1 paraquat-inducible protein A [Sphingomonas nostoxanthinifaciens]
MPQQLPPTHAAQLTRCARCAGTLERTNGRSLSLAFALSATLLLLLIPANLMPLLRTDVLGVSRTSRLASSAWIMLYDGWPWLAAIVFLFIVVAPIVRFGLLTLVLGALEFDVKADWLGPAFRWADKLQSWAMLDVFLLGLAVAYARLADSIAVRLGPGGVALIATAILSLFVRAALDKAAVWERIAPDAPPADPRTAIECTTCELLAPAEAEGASCRRCGDRLHRRKPQSMSRTIALTLAAVLLYIPANLYPLATLPIHYKPTTYTVLEGVIELAQANLWDLALLVFCASFLIPFLKLAGLGWCVVSVLRRSRSHLVAKTKVYRMVEEIGRWSMVDPFVIGTFVPVMTYNAFITGRAEPAAVPFTAVVVLTMISAKTFDPRLMWDAAERRD